MRRVPPPALQLIDLEKRYGDVSAVAGLSFEVAPGSITGLLGGNGAGKTTTIAMILGLVSPSGGAIRALGYPLDTQAAYARPFINFSSPYVDLPHRLTVWQNLNVFAALYGVRNRKERIREIGRDLGIESLFSRPAGRLSAGQKTRVALAKSLINEPRLLLLDEPTASLDPDTADWVRGYLLDYQGRTNAAILLASHNMAEVERMCDTVVVMKAGRAVERGTPSDLLARFGRETMEDVFLDIARDRRRAGERA